MPRSRYALIVIFVVSALAVVLTVLSRGGSGTGSRARPSSEPEGPSSPDVTRRPSPPSDAPVATGPPISTTPPQRPTTTPDVGSDAAASFYVAPDGSGDRCSRSAPCQSVAAAMERADAGDIVELADGDYDDLTIHRSAGGTSNVVVRAANPGGARADRLAVSTGSVTVRGILVEGKATLEEGADGSRFELLTVEGSVYVKASRTAVISSRIRPSGGDGIQIKPPDARGAVPEDVEIRNNDIGPARLRPGSDAHLDGIQVMGAEHLLIAGNRLREAASQTVLLKPDLGPIRHVMIQHNLIEQCSPQREECPGHYALQVRTGRHELEDVRVESNLIVGATFFDEHDGFRASSNLVTAPIGCVAGMSGNVVSEESRLCHSDRALPDRDLRRLADEWRTSLGWDQPAEE